MHLTKATHAIGAILVCKIHLIPVLICLLMLNMTPANANYTPYQHRISELEHTLALQREFTAMIWGTERPRIRKIRIHVTSYNPLRAQTSSHPFITASDKVVAPGMIAVSQDLLRSHRLKMGQKVVLRDLGSFIITDTTHKRFRNRVDIISFIPGWSKTFGVKTADLYYSL